jgi:hypothetical protein
MSYAAERPYVRLRRQMPRFDTLEDAQQFMQEQADAIHELNARIFFMQEQIATLAAATATTVDTLEDY